MAVVTISRQYGSGGTAVAGRVCEILGYQYLDKELIARAAAEIGLSGGEVVRFTEQHSKTRSFIDRILFPGPYVVAQVAVRTTDPTGVETLSVEELDKAECLNLVRTAIHAEYKEGNAIIVGRGGQAVLQEMPDVLHVRIGAPMQARILRIQEQDNVDMERAFDVARSHDRKTADYLKEVFGIEVDDPKLYHMMLNTGKLSVEQAAEVIVHAVGKITESSQNGSG